MTGISCAHIRWNISVETFPTNVTYVVTLPW